MADTHEYPTKQVKGTDLDDTMTLVGESGGLCAIYGVDPSNISPGLLNVTTEYGSLLLDPDEDYDVLDMIGDSERTYDVSVANTFDAKNPKDAVRQFVTWIVDNAYSAGYRVTDVTTPVTQYLTPSQNASMFIDADDVDFTIQED